MIELRKSGERGHADHGWLDSWHSFSFGDYYDPQYMGFGPLRVINEDRVAPGRGFGAHGHRDMEIISYVLAGELAHQDSMGNGSVLRPGDVQRMSAGRGVMHAEYNHSRDQPTHFLQIWIEPNVHGISPGYQEKHFPSSEKEGRLRLIASPDGAQGSVLIHQDARVFAGLFGDGRAEFSFVQGRRGYLHVARGALTVNGVALSAGDAIRVSEEAGLTIGPGDDAEILLFDLP
ncbi:MAG TPA: pirin family protein [Noviherbaspirillum sp.]|jgi:redox-sensitive bicupin YhaK (pirin superfamily)|uniref:pirin family protein n=1 Tax=Noviherbaspirillum sp. TaxID=1926288 RepID=UPI002F93127C